MSFEHSNYILLAIVVAVIMGFLFIKTRNSYLKYIEKYWFYSPSSFSNYRVATFIISISLLIISTLDLRGPEERIKATIPDQKTIIIIDSSASMLAEDVRPNRFQRSLFLARHFIKRAAGHQIAVVLFSDTQKRLVPFTDDIDLLDARVAALEKIDLRYGNSNINQAVKESLQYFKIDNDSEKIVGNILLFTDSEEHGGTFALEEGSDVNLAVVGVGTAAGAPIPLRSRTGVFLDYKKYKGEKVTSKLNESAIKQMGTDFKNFKYWVATSYIIPTDDILTFFRGIYKKKLGETDIRIRPVYGHVILITAVLIYFISSLLGLGKSFTKPTALLLAFVLFFGANGVEAQVEKKMAQKNKLELDKRKRVLKSGEATIEEKRFVAQELLKSGQAKEAGVLYNEIVDSNKEDINSLINLGTSLASTGNLKEALEAYDKAINIIPDGDQKEPLKNLVRNNVLTAIEQKKNNSKQKKKDKKDKKKKDKKKDKDKKDQKKSGGESSPDENQKQKNKSDDQKRKDKQKDKQKEKKRKEEQKKERQKKKEQKAKPSNLEDKEKQIKQKRKMVKIPAMLKQIMDQDRNLQEKYYKTNNKRKRRNNEKKDW